MGAVDPQQAFEEILSAEKYTARLSEMAVYGRSSFILDFDDVMLYSLELARELVDHPDETLKHASNAAFQRLRIADPSYAEKIEAVSVRISSLPEVTPIREIGAKYISKLIMVEGIVVRATPVQPMVVKAAFRCRACGEITPVKQEGAFLRQPYRCQNPDCHRTGPFDFVEDQSEYIDSQSFRIQELPEELPPGQIPTYLDLKATGSDFRNAARPGDQVRVVGVVRATSTVIPKAGRLRTLKIHVDVNNVVPVSREPESLNITPEEEAKIKELAADPWIHRKLIQSIAPSMYGNEHIKEACLYLLFGGVPKRLPDVNIRGDVHCLVVGDPSTFKSQLLQYVARVAPRGIYTSGRGTTAAGLTAAVVRTEQEGLTLEAGAMVLADRGVVAIDELEKLKPEDRSAIHTAMEQQVIPVAKGGIVATLNSRTAVLAAANPAFGRYEPARTVIENINLPVTILSRFDLIFILRDVPSEESDEKVSRHVLSLHRTHGAAVQPPIDQSLLRKYIAYAKNIMPVLTPEAEERLHQFYMKMRKASEGGSIAITLRQLESLVRIAEARARAALRSEVTAEDAEAAILITSRFLHDVGVDVETMKVDVDRIMTGKPQSLREKMSALMDIVVNLQRETGVAEASLVYEEGVRRLGVSRDEVMAIVAQLMREGTLYEPRPGFLKRT